MDSYIRFQSCFVDRICPLLELIGHNVFKPHFQRNYRWYILYMTLAAFFACAFYTIFWYDEIPVRLLCLAYTSLVVQVTNIIEQKADQNT